MAWDSDGAGVEVVGCVRGLGRVRLWGGLEFFEFSGAFEQSPYQWRQVAHGCALIVDGMAQPRDAHSQQRGIGAVAVMVMAVRLRVLAWLDAGRHRVGGVAGLGWRDSMLAFPHGVTALLAAIDLVAARIVQLDAAGRAGLHVVALSALCRRSAAHIRSLVDAKSMPSRCSGRFIESRRTMHAGRTPLQSPTIPPTGLPMRLSLQRQRSHGHARSNLSMGGVPQTGSGHYRRIDEKNACRVQNI
ncbi:hypothetical protein [Bifidobacterium aquikefiricola]|uniref:Uncharacterized protein n=1 Tax=Bifidobacterium aquikefiricola TaxID=3059038 RepID=A0AB39U7Y1_9BIFI